nr:uncharacterized protein CTRU02_07468 [Colletotrichum truncatum]KAF6791128.1 hypothetical protein CTRU02_07468 [Colletotrichum truncatum]
MNLLAFLTLLGLGSLVAAQRHSDFPANKYFCCGNGRTNDGLTRNCCGRNTFIPRVGESIPSCDLTDNSNPTGFINCCRGSGWKTCGPEI